MGAIIAITISKPIEIRMFETEIGVKLREKQIEQQDTYIEKTKQKYQVSRERISKDLLKFEKEIDSKTLRLEFLEKQYIEEARIITVGPRALALKEELDKIKNEINQDKQNPDYLKLKQEKQEIDDREKEELRDTEKIANNLDGLLERIKISHEVAGPEITIFITLLFLSIELTPIFFKLMLNKTPYDYLSENRDDLILAENGIEVRYDFYKDKEGVERHLVINHEAERLVYEKIKVTEIQKELTEYAIAKYKESEKKKIDANLDEYIKKINPNEFKS
jgi:hypothetical protein